ncbi:MAG: AraC family transcriptional regulator [Acidobacteria bacterium]|nr:MAG: AraC family transcriptional regulator [Acidobacteriota bacterium]
MEGTDALSELLRAVRLDSAIYFNAEFSEPWSLTSPESRVLGPALARRPGHVIIYHLLCEGRAYAQVPGGERVDLVAGDLVTFPHGHRHRLGRGERATPIDAGAALDAFLKRGLELLRAGGGGERSRFICGYLLCDPQLCQSFLGGLPPLVKVNIREAPSAEWLQNSLEFSVTEAANRGAGAGAMLTKLSEAAFAETLRRYARALPAGETGWFAGARDPEVGKALTLIHHRPAHPWTVADLAREAGASRTVLAERFRHFLGEPPMTYLTRWRLRLAASALTSTSRGIAEIAADVGYESEASFNRAFKREYALPPAAYRRDKAGV